MRGRVLIVDDDRARGEELAGELRGLGFDTMIEQDARTALARIRQADLDVAIVSLGLAEGSSVQLCRDLVQASPALPVILSAAGTVDRAVEAIRAGAYDFLSTPTDLDQIAVALDRAVEHHILKSEVRRLQRAEDEAFRIAEMLGDSPSMRELFRLVERTAVTDASILIVGETGTGKELVARALHEKSRRNAGPFVAVNCAAVQDTLLESELFGHARGAFTDAKTARVGLFVQATRGTLFLDEIGEMSLALQPKLLRVLQERKVRPVGSDTEVPVDVRIIAATNRDLDVEADTGAFRRDLYYRLNVISIYVPPLRARGNDILLLAEHFIQESAERADVPVRGLSTAAAEKLLGYAWPGNVRELQNAMERAVALADRGHVRVDDLPERIRRSDARPAPLVATDEATDLVTLDELEARYIQRVLSVMGGNKSMAARVLGLDRTTLYRKLKRFGLEAVANAQGAASTSSSSGSSPVSSTSSESAASESPAPASSASESDAESPPRASTPSSEPSTS